MAKDTKDARKLQRTMVTVTPATAARSQLEVSLQVGKNTILHRYDVIENTIGRAEASVYFRYAFGPYEECLMKDPHLQSIFSVRAASALVRKQVIHTATGEDNEEAVEIVDFVEAVLERIGRTDRDLGWVSDMCENMYRGLALGLNIQEVIFEPYEWRGQKRWGIRKLHTHHPSLFLFDIAGQLRYKRDESDREGILAPQNKFTVFRPHTEYDNPYGVPLMRHVFFASTLKRFLMLLMANYIEGFAQPKPMCSISEDISDTDLEVLQTLVTNYNNVHGATIPAEATLELLSPPAVSPQIYSVALQMLNAEMSKGVLGQTLTTETSGSGSYALAAVHMLVREDLVRRDILAIEAFYNRVIIPLIVSVNYPDWENRPLPVCRIYPEVDRQAEIKIDAALAQIMRVPESYLQNKYDIPVPVGDEPVVRPPVSVSLDDTH